MRCGPRPTSVRTRTLRAPESELPGIGLAVLPGHLPWRAITLDSKSEKPLRVFVNPFTIWTDLAFKTGLAMWASAHAAAVRANNSAKVAVIPTADAPAPKAQEAAKLAEEMLASA